jgi:cytochrome P450
MSRSAPALALCIGTRFGQLEIRTIATALLSRFSYELAPGYRLRVRQQPTIGPADGVALVISERRPAPSAVAAGVA